MEKLDGKTRDVVQDNIEKLKQLFPEVFTEEKIDFEKLQLTLGEHIETEKERYEFTWNGKTEAIQLAQKQSTGTLRPCKEESVDWDTTQNLYIEGDNLEVLRLLQNSYRNKVKMIYIDPPYNTGKDFVYKDNFHDNVKNYKESLDESYKSNAETNGRYHTDWLNMMYPRLKIAKSLLRDDGVIFISIDDHEMNNLKKVCDEIFGESNFVSSVVWKRKRGRDNSAKWFSKSHEYILIYAKEKRYFDVNLLELDEETKKAYRNPDNDSRGPYRMLAVWARGTQSGVKYDFTNKEGQYFEERLWLFSKSNLTKLDNEDKLIVRGDNIYRKLFITENKGKIPETIWDDTSNAANASDEIKNLFGEIIFDTPKPIPYISRMIEIASSDQDIILDFFSGSATTAHAIINSNIGTSTNRKFIMVQIPEQIAEKQIAFKAGYKNICEIGKERIRRAGQKIKEENKDKEGIENLDIGFKVFKLDKTNLKIWDEEVEDIETDLLFFEGAVKEGRSQEDVLYEILLKYGLDLTLPIEEEKVGDVTAFSVGLGYLVVCLDQNLSITDIEELVKNYPDCERMVFLDNGFATDEVKINAEQILKRNGVQDIRVI